MGMAKSVRGRQITLKPGTMVDALRLSLPREASFARIGPILGPVVAKLVAKPCAAH
jgi:hypothetical protein